MTYRIKREDELAYFWCPFNDALDCERCKCSRCGWNPEVAEIRLQRLRQSELVRLKRSLAEANERLEQLEKLKSRLLRIPYKGTGS